MYAPFTKQGNRWIRLELNGVDAPAFKKETAIRFYQGWLLDGVLVVGERRELRKVKEA